MAISPEISKKSSSIPLAIVALIGAVSIKAGKMPAEKVINTSTSSKEEQGLNGFSVRPKWLHESYHNTQTHPTPAQIAAKEVTPLQFKKWSKVNICEEDGDWHVSGAVYSGGLGESNENWIIYGGRQFSNTAATATPDEQIVVAERIEKDPPDQNGCDGSW